MPYHSARRETLAGMRSPAQGARCTYYYKLKEQAS